jgi:hypothetical protein
MNTQTTGVFKILIGNKLHTYTNYDEIPKTFTNLILFKLDYPSEPHSEEEHLMIEEKANLIHELMARETNGH